MYLYIYEGYAGNRIKAASTEMLVLRALSMYMAEENGDPGTDAEIIRGAKGKPEFRDLPVEFSVSHTGSLWVCLMGKQRSGIDIQLLRNVRYEKISERFFTRDEHHYTELWGIDGFLDIWVRKEAFIKYLGISIGEGINRFSVVRDDKLAESAVLRGSRAFFEEIEISEDIRCVCALREREEIWTRTIN